MALEYIIVRTESYLSLIEKVNHYLHERWECTGGVEIVLLGFDEDGNASQRFYQALVRKYL